jgi:hypothetical protein
MEKSFCSASASSHPPLIPRFVTDSPSVRHESFLQLTTMVASSNGFAPSSPASVVVVPGLQRARHRCDAVVASCPFASLGGVHARLGGGCGDGPVEPSTVLTMSASPTKAAPRKRDVAATRPRRRRVRFESDGGAPDGVRSTFYVYEKVTVEEKELCWHSKHDTQRMKQNVRSEAGEFVRLHPEYLKGLEELFQSPLVRPHPAASSTLSSSSAAAAAEQNDDVPAKAFDRAAFVATEMSREDPPRGLEYRMSYLIHRHKELTTAAVLRRQSQLRMREAPDAAPSSSSSSSSSPSSSSSSTSTSTQAAGPTTTTTTDDEALAACCQHLSRCSRELAIEYGTADAIQAQRAYGGVYRLCLVLL